MATKVFLKLHGETQGDIHGSATGIAAVENWINVMAVDHEVVSPRDAASGLPTGKRQHKPIVLTKEVDKSTPLIDSVLCNNENLTQVEIRVYDDWAARGVFVHRYTIQLTNASVAAIKTELLNTAYTDNAALKMREKVSLCYQKIVCTWVDGGITAEDDWEAPVV